jgi:hypothetical protein
MQLSVLAQAFFDGFGFTGLFKPLRRPGAPESYFRRDEDADIIVESVTGEPREIRISKSADPERWESLRTLLADQENATVTRATHGRATEQEQAEETADTRATTQRTQFHSR